MLTLRVFPTRTKATPIDGLAFVGDPPLFRPSPEEVSRIDVSVTFSWDKREGERLAEAWRAFYPDAQVRVGGPAYHGPGNLPGEFEPGRYLKPGYTITSRGCCRACEFCAVQDREGAPREIPIQDGWNVLDNNLLACSERHITAVFEMLRRQPQRAELTGGLDARILLKKPWIVEQLLALRLEKLFLAYDSPEQWEATRAAIILLRNAGLTRDHIHCYVLTAFDPEDTPAKAEARCEQVLEAGGIAFMMLYQPTEGLRIPRGDWAAVGHKYRRAASQLPAGRRADLEARRPTV